MARPFVTNWNGSKCGGEKCMSGKNVDADHVIKF